jgi:hypothetical protein
VRAANQPVNQSSATLSCDSIARKAEAYLALVLASKLTGLKARKRNNWLEQLKPAIRLCVTWSCDYAQLVTFYQREAFHQGQTGDICETRTRLKLQKVFLPLSFMMEVYAVNMSTRRGQFVTLPGGKLCNWNKSLD